jgi:hypothetical protein
VRKKTLSIAIALAIGFGSVPATGADIPDEQYSFNVRQFSSLFPDYPAVKSPNLNSIFVWFHDKVGYPSVPKLWSVGADSRNLNCGSIDKIECQDRTRFDYVANYPFCSAAEVTDCIEEVFALSENGQRTKATNIEYVPRNPLVVNQRSNYHPGGSSKEIFDLPGIAHKGGSTKYSIEVLNSGRFTILDRKNAASGYSSEDQNFFVKITPVNMKSGTFQIPDSPFRLPNGYDATCAVLDVDRCGMAQGFPDGYKFGVSIRMNNRIYGWLQGRMQAPEFSSTDLPGGSKKITVTGFPVKVPSISGGGHCKDNLSPFLQEKYAAPCAVGFPQFREYTSENGTVGLKAFEEWLPVLGEKATVMPSTWSFRNIKKDEFPAAGLRAGQCIVSAMKTGVGGMVSTNATAFSSGPPVFNELTQSLDYKVAAPHLTSEGKVFRGYYNLKMTTETARCIYDFKPIPIQATISVVTQDGEKIVGTTVVNTNDDWIELTAANFEFSSPVLRVRLTDKIDTVKPVVEPTLSPTPSPTATTTAKKVTITCTKGKISKKVTAIKPTCPKGYKKKS